jgi:uncharacterized protein
MPADLPSTILVILLTAADAVLGLWPYVVLGITLAAVMGRLMPGDLFPRRHGMAGVVSAPVAAAAGAISPLPTAGAVPLLLRLRQEGLPSRSALAFVLASCLMNPQLFVLTLGALGLPFALAQLGAVLLLSTGLGLAFGRRLALAGLPGLPGGEPERAWEPERGPMQLVALAGHVGFYFLAGVLLGAVLQVLLPQLGVLDWLAGRGLLSTPLLSWLAAPLYTCGGSAVPLARSLGQSGFSQGTLFSFLIAGPALRGSSLGNLGCLLPKRALIACLAVLLLASGLLGFGLDQWLGWA